MESAEEISERLWGWQKNRNCVSAKGWELYKIHYFDGIHQNIFPKHSTITECQVQSTYYRLVERFSAFVNQRNQRNSMSKDNALKAAFPPTQTKVFIQEKPQKLQGGKATGSCAQTSLFWPSSHLPLVLFESLSQDDRVTETDSRPCRWGAELVREERCSLLPTDHPLPQPEQDRWSTLQDLYYGRRIITPNRESRHPHFPTAVWE